MRTCGCPVSVTLRVVHDFPGGYVHQTVSGFGISEIVFVLRLMPHFVRHGLDDSFLIPVRHFQIPFQCKRIHYSIGTYILEVVVEIHFAVRVTFDAIQLVLNACQLRQPFHRRLAAIA